MLPVRCWKLPYTKETNGRYRDIRELEVRLPKRRFARISINGIHRASKSHVKQYKAYNPGWIVGTEWITVEWTHFRRHCWHFSLEAYRRGITFSYGKRIV